MQQFWELLELCWSEPSLRPSMKEVDRVLRGLALGTDVSP